MTILLLLLAAVSLTLGSFADRIAGRFMNAFFSGQHRTHIIVVRAVGRQRGLGYAAGALLLVTLAATLV